MISDVSGDIDSRTAVEPAERGGVVVARNVDAETSPMVNTGEGATTEGDDEW